MAKHYWDTRPKSSRIRYWAVRPKGIPDHIRIERCLTSQEAVAMAFGRPIYGDSWEIKDLGTIAAVIQSDKKRIALLKDPEGWETVEGPKTK